MQQYDITKHVEMHGHMNVKLMSCSLSVCDVMAPPESLGNFLFHLVSETVTKMC